VRFRQIHKELCYCLVNKRNARAATLFTKKSELQKCLKRNFKSAKLKTLRCKLSPNIWQSILHLNHFLFEKLGKNAFQNIINGLCTKINQFRLDLCTLQSTGKTCKRGIYIGQACLGRVFNSRSGYTQAMHFHPYEAKRPNLNLKTRTKQF